MQQGQLQQIQQLCRQFDEVSQTFYSFQNILPQDVQEVSLFFNICINEVKKLRNILQGSNKTCLDMELFNKYLENLSSALVFTKEILGTLGKAQQGQNVLAFFKKKQQEKTQQNIFLAKSNYYTALKEGEILQNQVQFKNPRYRETNKNFQNTSLQQMMGITYSQMAAQQDLPQNASAGVYSLLEQSSSRERDNASRSNNNESNQVVQQQQVPTQNYKEKQSEYLEPNPRVSEISEQDIQVLQDSNDLQNIGGSAYQDNKKNQNIYNKTKNLSQLNQLSSNSFQNGLVGTGENLNSNSIEASLSFAGKSPKNQSPKLSPKHGQNGLTSSFNDLIMQSPSKLQNSNTDTRFPEDTNRTHQSVSILGQIKEDSQLINNQNQDKTISSSQSEQENGINTKVDAIQSNNQQLNNQNIAQSDNVFDQLSKFQWQRQQEALATINEENSLSSMAINKQSIGNSKQKMAQNQELLKNQSVMNNLLLANSSGGAPSTTSQNSITNTQQGGTAYFQKPLRVSFDDQHQQSGDASKHNDYNQGLRQGQGSQNLPQGLSDTIGDMLHLNNTNGLMGNLEQYRNSMPKTKSMDSFHNKDGQELNGRQSFSQSQQKSLRRSLSNDEQYSQQQLSPRNRISDTLNQYEGQSPKKHGPHKFQSIFKMFQKKDKKGIGSKKQSHKQNTQDNNLLNEPYNTDHTQRDHFSKHNLDVLRQDLKKSSTQREQVNNNLNAQNNQDYALENQQPHQSDHFQIRGPYNKNLVLQGSANLLKSRSNSNLSSLEQSNLGIQGFRQQGTINLDNKKGFFNDNQVKEVLKRSSSLEKRKNGVEWQDLQRAQTNSSEEMQQQNNQDLRIENLPQPKLKFEKLQNLFTSGSRSPDVYEASDKLVLRGKPKFGAVKPQQLQQQQQQQLQQPIQQQQQQEPVQQQQHQQQQQYDKQSSDDLIKNKSTQNYQEQLDSPQINRTSTNSGRIGLSSDDLSNKFYDISNGKVKINYGSQNDSKIIASSGELGTNFTSAINQTPTQTSIQGFETPTKGNLDVQRSLSQSSIQGLQNTINYDSDQKELQPIQNTDQHMFGQQSSKHLPKFNLQLQRSNSLDAQTQKTVETQNQSQKQNVILSPKKGLNFSPRKTSRKEKEPTTSEKQQFEQVPQNSNPIQKLQQSISLTQKDQKFANEHARQYEDSLQKQRVYSKGAIPRNKTKSPRNQLPARNFNQSPTFQKGRRSPSYKDLSDSETKGYQSSDLDQNQHNMDIESQGEDNKNSRILSTNNSNRSGSTKLEQLEKQFKENAILMEKMKSQDTKKLGKTNSDLSMLPPPNKKPLCNETASLLTKSSTEQDPSIARLNNMFDQEQDRLKQSKLSSRGSNDDKPPLSPRMLSPRIAGKPQPQAQRQDDSGWYLTDKGLKYTNSQDLKESEKKNVAQNEKVQGDQKGKRSSQLSPAKTQGRLGFGLLGQSQYTSSQELDDTGNKQSEKDQAKTNKSPKKSPSKAQSFLFGQNKRDSQQGDQQKKKSFKLFEVYQQPSEDNFMEYIPGGLRKYGSNLQDRFKSNFLSKVSPSWDAKRDSEKKQEVEKKQSDRLDTFSVPMNINPSQQKLQVFKQLQNKNLDLQGQDQSQLANNQNYNSPGQTFRSPRGQYLRSPRNTNVSEFDKNLHSPFKHASKNENASQYSGTDSYDKISPKVNIKNKEQDRQSPSFSQQETQIGGVLQDNIRQNNQGISPNLGIVSPKSPRSPMRSPKQAQNQSVLRQEFQKIKKGEDTPQYDIDSQIQSPSKQFFSPLNLSPNRSPRDAQKSPRDIKISPQNQSKLKQQFQVMQQGNYNSEDENQINSRLQQPNKQFNNYDLLQDMQSMNGKEQISKSNDSLQLSSIPQNKRGSSSKAKHSDNNKQSFETRSYNDYMLSPAFNSNKDRISQGDKVSGDQGFSTQNPVQGSPPYNQLDSQIGGSDNLSDVKMKVAPIKTKKGKQKSGEQSLDLPKAPRKSDHQKTIKQVPDQILEVEEEDQPLNSAFQRKPKFILSEPLPYDQREVSQYHSQSLEQAYRDHKQKQQSSKQNISKNNQDSFGFQNSDKVRNDSQSRKLSVTGGSNSRQKRNYKSAKSSRIQKQVSVQRSNSKQAESSNDEKAEDIVISFSDNLNVTDVQQIQKDYQPSIFNCKKAPGNTDSKGEIVIDMGQKLPAKNWYRQDSAQAKTSLLNSKEMLTNRHLQMYLQQQQEAAQEHSLNKLSKTQQNGGFSFSDSFNSQQQAEFQVGDQEKEEIRNLQTRWDSEDLTGKQKVQGDQEFEDQDQLRVRTKNRRRSRGASKGQQGRRSSRQNQNQPLIEDYESYGDDQANEFKTKVEPLNKTQDAGIYQRSQKQDKIQNQFDSEKQDGKIQQNLKQAALDQKSDSDSDHLVVNKLNNRSQQNIAQLQTSNKNINQLPQDTQKVNQSDTLTQNQSDTLTQSAPQLFRVTGEASLALPLNQAQIEEKKQEAQKFVQEQLSNQKSYVHDQGANQRNKSFVPPSTGNISNMNYKQYLAYLREQKQKESDLAKQQESFSSKMKRKGDTFIQLHNSDDFKNQQLADNLVNPELNNTQTTNDVIAKAREDNVKDSLDDDVINDLNQQDSPSSTFPVRRVDSPHLKRSQNYDKQFYIENDNQNLGHADSLNQGSLSLGQRQQTPVNILKQESIGFSFPQGDTLQNSKAQSLGLQPNEIDEINQKNPGLFAKKSKQARINLERQSPVRRQIQKGKNAVNKIMHDVNIIPVPFVTPHLNRSQSAQKQKNVHFNFEDDSMGQQSGGAQQLDNYRNADPLTCQVCSNKYNNQDRVPKLVCQKGHTICESCSVQEILDKAIEIGGMYCPICNTKINYGGSFPVDFEILDQVNLVIEQENQDQLLSWTKLDQGSNTRRARSRILDDKNMNPFNYPGGRQFTNNSQMFNDTSDPDISISDPKVKGLEKQAKMMSNPNLRFRSNQQQDFTNAYNQLQERDSVDTFSQPNSPINAQQQSDVKSIIQGLNTEQIDKIRKALIDLRLQLSYENLKFNRQFVKQGGIEDLLHIKYGAQFQNEIYYNGDDLISDNSIINLGLLAKSDAKIKSDVVKKISDKKISELLHQQNESILLHNLDFLDLLAKPNQGLDHMQDPGKPPDSADIDFVNTISKQTFAFIRQRTMETEGDVQIRLMQLLLKIVPISRQFQLEMLSLQTLNNSIYLIGKSPNPVLVSSVAYLIGIITNMDSHRLTVDTMTKYNAQQFDKLLLNLLDKLLMPQFESGRPSFLYALQGLAKSSQRLKDRISNKDSIQKILNVAYNSKDPSAQVAAVSLLQQLLYNNVLGQRSFIEARGFSQLATIFFQSKGQGQMVPLIHFIIKEASKNKEAVIQIRSSGLQRFAR